MTSSRTSVFCGNSRCPSCYDLGSDERRCRATTSRGLSHSSRESQESNAVSNSSFFSDNIYVTEYYNRPCYIAESSELIHRSRWRNLKNFFRRQRYRLWIQKYRVIRLVKKKRARRKKSKKLHGKVTKELIESINSASSTLEQRNIHDKQ